MLQIIAMDLVFWSEVSKKQQILYTFFEPYTSENECDRNNIHQPFGSVCISLLKGDRWFSSDRHVSVLKISGRHLLFMAVYGGSQPTPTPPLSRTYPSQK